ncbi:hypothetical protein [Morganella morganii]|uniref:hypothetical protein n=1 Tax=Morganella morganii TaxID=582 RepID=UPI001163CC8A|nr:hypothetical protein [Morganella morganii]QQO72265.1 hypothetical protein IDH72_17825 [Morganella morganii]
MNNNNKNYITNKKGKNTDFSPHKITSNVDNMKNCANSLAVLELIQQDRQRRRRTGTSSQTRHRFTPATRQHGNTATRH